MPELGRPAYRDVLMEIIERFTRGKSGGSDGGEDVVVVNGSFAAVIDGATDKSGGRYRALSGGRLVAEALADALGLISPLVGGAEVIAQLTAAVARAVADAGGDLDSPTRPSANVVIYNAVRREIVRVGDCAFRLHGRTDAPTKRIDQIAADARAALLEAVRLAGTLEATEPDPGIEMIAPLLGMQGMFQNHPDHPLGFGVLDGHTVPLRYLEVVDVGDAKELILASDGYPVVCDTLAESESQLTLALAVDPLCVGRLRSTKGLAPEQVRFEGRSYLRLRI